MEDDDSAGKTLFLNVLAGLMQSTNCERWLRPGKRPDWLRFALAGTIGDAVVPYFSTTLPGSVNTCER